MNRLITLLATACLLTACHDEKTEDVKPPNLEPTLYVEAATGITRTEATLAGGIVTHGETDMPELKFVYGPESEMSFTTPVLTPDREGRVSAHLTDLVAGTTYQYRLQGYNGRVTLSSDTRSFATEQNDLPTVGVPTLLCKGPTSIIVGYTLVADGGETVTETGCYVWNTATGDTLKMPLTSDTHDYQLRIGGLARYSTYELQPYAINRVGEARGDKLAFDTQDPVVWTEPGMLATLFGDDLYEFESLALAGPMNGDDLYLLRLMMGREGDESATQGRLTHVDLTEATIVEGGRSYGYSRYSANDVVGYGLFAYCDRLVEVALPASAKVIEKNAFLNCHTLEKLGIPIDISEVLPSDGCEKLACISIPPSNTHYSSVDGVLLNAAHTEIVWFPKGKTGNYNLPAAITEIGDYAFSGCKLTKFTFPQGFKKLGQSVFYGSMLEEVVTPSTLGTIPTATFQSCTQLSTVWLGSGTELVSDYAFDGCPLEHLYVEAVYPPVCYSNTFTSSYELFQKCTLHVPASSLQIYKNHRTWGQFEHITAIN